MDSLTAEGKSKRRQASAFRGIKSIAKEAGCSPSTVSRVVNGSYEGFSVRKELEEKILRIARSFDYKPNPYLRAMRAKRTKLVAIFDVSYNFLGVDAQARMEFIRIIRQAGLTESLKYVERDEPEEHKVGFPIDAALLFDVCEKETLRYFESNRIPYAVINGICGPSGTSILVDEETNVKLVLEHLFDLGHRRIAYANQTGRPRRVAHYSIPQRERFYREFMESHGLEPFPESFDNRISPEDFVAKAVKGGVTAILCYHEEKLLEIMHAAWRLGVSVPGDMSLACFNDDKILSLLTPPVTCMSTPGHEMGATAAETLLNMLDGKIVPSGKACKLSGRLILRESTAAPPRRAGRKA